VLEKTAGIRTETQPLNDISCWLSVFQRTNFGQPGNAYFGRYAELREVAADRLKRQERSVPLDGDRASCQEAVCTCGRRRKRDLNGFGIASRDPVLAEGDLRRLAKCWRNEASQQEINRIETHCNFGLISEYITYSILNEREIESKSGERSMRISARCVTLSPGRSGWSKGEQSPYDRITLPFTALGLTDCGFFAGALPVMAGSLDIDRQREPRDANTKDKWERIDCK
jgi:hypothetical protein